MKKILFIFSFISSISYAQLEEFLPSSFSSPVIVNNKMVFRLFTPEFGTELWVTDGTAEGTQLLIDINPGPGSSNVSISDIYVIDGYLYFNALHTPHTVWRTDGTPEGTQAHVNNTAIFDPTGFRKCNGFIIFASKISGNQNFWRLWRMTSFPDSEVPIINTFDGKVINNVHLGFAKKDETTLIFGGNTTEDGWAIFGTTGATTDLIIDLYQGNNATFNNYQQFRNAKNIDGKIYFNGFQEATGFEAWTTIGTAGSTNLLKDINANNTVVNSGSAPDQWTKVGNTVYFTANDGINGREVWKTNGTTSGTSLVKDVHPGNNSNFGPFALIEFNNQLYFLQNDGTNGNQIWKSNGTEVGTVMISNPQIISSVSSSPSFDSADNKLFFSGFSPQFGNELFMIDQNDEISLVADINPGINGSDPGFVIEYNGYIYFMARFGNTTNTFRTYRIALNNLNVDSPIKSITNIKVCPNPTSDYFEMTSTDDQTFEIELVDIMGKKYPVNKMSKNKFDISHLSKGVYIIKLKNYSNHNITNFKIIKN